MEVFTIVIGSFNNEDWSLKRIEGTQFSYDNTKCFLYETELGFYIVSDCDTGCQIASRSNKSDAILDTIMSIENTEKYKQVIEDTKKLLALNNIKTPVNPI